MYKMLIVDDEYFIREGMKKIIDWNAQGIEIVGTAENGIQGIGKIRELKPDIVLTDIRMKAMDGLAMLDVLREEGIKCKVIIMSGYKVFEYAKKAMEEGVAFYLLKPVSKQELLEAVQKITSILDQEKTELIPKKLIESENLIKKCLENKGEDPIVNFKGPYIVISFRFIPAASLNMQERSEVFNLLLAQRENLYAYFKNENELMVLLCNDISPEMAVKKLRLTLTEHLQRKVFAGVSCVQNKTEEFATACSEAGKALQYILYGTSEVVNYFDIMNSFNKIEIDYVNLSKEIIHAVEICNREKVAELLKNVSQSMMKARYNPEEVWNWFKNLYLNLQNTTRLMQVKVSEQEWINRVDEYTLWEITEMMLEFCSSCIIAIGNSRKGDVSKTIRDVVAYIDNHYTEDISLEQLEAIFYTEFSYISKLFKKEMGVTYLQYITEKRIAKAKELMENPELTMYQIANGVGYTDAKYFSQLFKKLEGVTPKEYREIQKNRV